MGKNQTTGSQFIVEGSGNNIAANADGTVTINGQQHQTPVAVTDGTNTVVIVQTSDSTPTS
jgi:hypothetical protein